MLLGLDVGGTFTDAVIIEGHRVIASAKARTTKDNLMDGIGAALDAVLQSLRTHAAKTGEDDSVMKSIEQVTLSTTVVTNTIVEHKEKPVDLYVITGPGMNVDHSFPVRPQYIKGYTDHRGIVVETSVVDISANRHKHNLAAVSAKFGVRNPQEELFVANQLKPHYDVISTGSSLSGSLNFPRRTISAYFNSAVTPVFTSFKMSVEEALRKRNITAPLYILKADGGSLPIAHMKSRPVETVFTGPAATVLGLYALRAVGDSHTVALDIGGTTTDISLWKQGRPLMTKNGVSIREYPSAVRSFAVTSVGIGGESVVRIEDGGLTVGPERVGPSAALGGKEPTLGDALIVSGFARYGDVKLAEESIRALDSSCPVEESAQKIIHTALQTIQCGIEDVVAAENKRPVYVVADIVNPDLFKPAQLVVVGGTASSLGESIGTYLNLPVTIPDNAAVANAIGAAVALSTIEITVHVDTKRRMLVVPELGIKEANCTLRRGDDVVDYAKTLLYAEADRLGLNHHQDVEIISLEDFPVVEGWRSLERLITVKVQLEAGVKHHVE
ncbi:hydantoinase/oxoprolinase family protein [Veillonella rodentium]|uniref:N-methylhydantoinase A/acetone carboxylase, beta subunit n=1 Tax=Veillonella rodentium TaxID=248315 RepID=A0A239YKE9_9FIRM|nr:hydantoinase/oxoprolinase family protein [Veillonella rodentium]SNV59220.1 N-methylhydantoinase A/acetone carboxylase, beta subunit [Veillonella rodentium]